VPVGDLEGRGGLLVKLSRSGVFLSDLNQGCSAAYQMQYLFGVGQLG